ncbi:ribbon-helix-helix domain-containing protein [Novosphingobium sp. ZN18A2]|uniref:ribbon-helix-helix domain-containing protein n=1 Tax=Novosphingobium sp. ZN18A2 TaxID=3079861 RepID=UPI0030D5EB85
MTTPYHPPVKRSVEIAGHKTSISLEPLFWDMLREAAVAEAVPVNALVARIDAERIGAENPPGLASAVRLWLVGWLAARGRGAHPQPLPQARGERDLPNRR